MNKNKVRVYQIYYKKSQRLALDSAFTPYFNAPSGNLTTETDVMEAISSSVCDLPDYWGVVSWKFNFKTQINGQTFKRFVADHPGYDVYFINPFLLELKHLNPWVQGDQWHPGLIKIAQKFFQEIDPTYNVSLVDHDYSSTAYCNFFVGNAKFWTRYLELLERLNSFLKEPDVVQLSDAPEPTRNMQLSVFMRERIICYLLKSDAIRSLPFIYSNPREHLTQEQVRLLQSPLTHSDRISIVGTTHETRFVRAIKYRISLSVWATVIVNGWYRLTGK